MNTFEMTIANMTSTEISNFEVILDNAIKTSEEFNEVVRNEFVNFNIDFDTTNNLSTFFVTAFLKAVKEKSETGIACHLEKFDEELQNIDTICDAKPEIFRSNYKMMAALMKFHTTMGELARALGMK